jgi:type III restriction enzyme
VSGKVVIQNPVINSPFSEPARHCRFDALGITDEVVESRRQSAYFRPVPPPKKKGVQQTLDDVWNEQREQPNDFINEVRDAVAYWRSGDYQGITRTTRALLQHWRRPDRHPPLFFCQLEAIETAIFLTECAPRYRSGYLETKLREANEQGNSPLQRRPSRWPRAAARPSSWRCSSPGRSSTSSQTPRTSVSVMPS